MGAVGVGVGDAALVEEIADSVVAVIAGRLALVGAEGTGG